MSDQVVNGKLFTAGEESMEIFGTSLRRLRHDRWILDNDFTMKPPSYSYSEHLGMLLGACLDRGILDQIDHIVVTPSFFNILYVQGSISLDQMRVADEDVNEPYVAVHAIPFAGHRYTFELCHTSKVCKLRRKKTQLLLL